VRSFFASAALGLVTVGTLLALAMQGAGWMGG
jgi:hypothetical protein